MESAELKMDLSELVELLELQMFVGKSEETEELFTMTNVTTEI